MSRGEVWDAATTEPAVGICVLPALPSDLGVRVSDCFGGPEFGSRYYCLPSANAVDLKINPPDARDADYAPEVGFAEDSPRGGPLDEGEPDEAGEE